MVSIVWHKVLLCLGLCSRYTIQPGSTWFFLKWCMDGGGREIDETRFCYVTFQPICLQCITTYGLQRKSTTIYCLERWCKEFERESLINWWWSALLIQSAVEMHNEDWPLQGHSAKKRLELGMPSPPLNRPWQDRQTDSHKEWREHVFNLTWVLLEGVLTYFYPTIWAKLTK